MPGSGLRRAPLAAGTLRGWGLESADVFGWSGRSSGLVGRGREPAELPASASGKGPIGYC